MSKASRPEGQMQKRLQSIVAVLLFCMPLAAFAIEAPKLPSSAKKLSAKEIIELMGDVPLTFEEYDGGYLRTGTVVIDFQTNKLDAKTECSGVPCQISGKAWTRDDMFCHEVYTGFEICAFVYLDGSALYFVGTDGKVIAIDKRQ
jgi:hypothetical protein